ncbi:hypothetical protein NX059_010129 [Plenodomus lindquistii]|nr:hypothetical protein NX059_010129 [Plenodomus lindquistii]
MPSGFAQSNGSIRPGGKYAVMFDNNTVVTPFPSVDAPLDHGHSTFTNLSPVLLLWVRICQELHPLWISIACCHLRPFRTSLPPCVMRGDHLILVFFFIFRIRPNTEEENLAKPLRFTNAIG